MTENNEHGEPIHSELILPQTKLPWRAPKKIRIEMIKKTMLTTGSNTDGLGGSSSGPI